ncbi:MAG: branched-chain amino acid ABC transporter permease [Anaerolineae bacterium]
MSSRIFWIVLMLTALVIPFILPGYLIFIVTLGGVWAIAAVGLNLLTGYTGQISIGHAGFVSLGAYTSALLTLKAGLSFWLALPIAGIVAGIVGFGLGLPALRLSGPYLTIATLGFGVAVAQIAQKWEPVTGGFQGLHPPRPSFGSWALESDAALYLLVLAVLLLMTWLAANLLHSPYGRAFIALRDSEPAAQAAGISLARYKTLAFALSAFYAGVAGSLYAHLVGFISPPDFGLSVSIFLISIIVIGGLASLPGSILGAVVLTVLFQRLSGLRDLRSVVYGVSLVLMVIFLPGGLARIRLPVRLWPGGKVTE